MSFVYSMGLLGAFLAGCGLGQLDTYSPATHTAFGTSFRTMAEHDSVMSGREWPYILEHAAGRGHLLYYGSRHTQNPDDPQIGDIVDRWTAFAPTVAVTENRLGFYIGGLNRAVSSYGEFGAVHALARRGDVPIYTLEPSWDDEVAEMTAAFPVEEVTLFYTLRVFLSERGQERSPHEVDALAAHLLRKRGGRPGLQGSVPDLAALDALWAERFSELGSWRTLPPEAIHPSANPNRLQLLANLANEIRDRHAVRIIQDLLSQGHRVFAIAGGSHVVKQEPVLRAGLPSAMALPPGQ